MMVYTSGAIASTNLPIEEGVSFGETLSKYCRKLAYDEDHVFGDKANDLTASEKDSYIKSDVTQLRDLSKLMLSIILYMGAKRSEWERDEPSLPSRKKPNKPKQNKLASPNWLGQKLSLIHI
mgnify:CR=1 FL=1